MQFAQQVKQSGKTQDEMKARITLRGVYGVAEEWKRGVDTVRRYAEDPVMGLGMVDPPLFGKYEHKDTETLRHECVLEMFELCKELEESNRKLRQALNERDEEDKKKDAIKHIDYSELLDNIRNKKAQFRMQCQEAN